MHDIGQRFTKPFFAAQKTDKVNTIFHFELVQKCQISMWHYHLNKDIIDR
jgi:hypothetical protein